MPETFLALTLSVGLNMRLHATTGSSYCCWSGELDRMASLTLFEVEQLTKCVGGWLVDRVLRMGSAGRNMSTKGLFILSSWSHSLPSSSCGPVSNLVLR